MNPNFGRILAVFSVLVPRSAPVTARFGGTRAAQPTHAYQIHVYRATVRPDSGRCRRGFAPRMGSPTSIVGLGAGWGAAIRKVGAAKPAADQIVEDAAPSLAALPAHGLDRKQPLLTIRTPRTTSSEIAVALWPKELTRRFVPGGNFDPVALRHKPLRHLASHRCLLSGHQDPNRF